MLKKIKIFNDPIYGFITIQSAIVFKIIEHPYFQRLRRISQMGLSYLVYPGANHTRFHHALGGVYLMQKVIDTLRMKNVKISKSEEEALYIAILLHDIGHGPFSHTLEHSIVKNIQHEEISLHFMEFLNKEFKEKLSLAIQIFKGEYSREFMHQLISSQLDIDRLDYLKRDSFYSGVAEGNINSERLIAMLNVKNENLVIDSKGIYSVEKFIIARRLMYWQVYLHKTSLIAEAILVKILKRAKELTKLGDKLLASEALQYFLKSNIDKNDFDNNRLHLFSKLDDNDIISALKAWCNHKDFVLSSLCKSIINRKLPKVEMQNQKFSKNYFDKIEKTVAQNLSINKEQLQYFVFKGEIKNIAYSSVNERINILYKNGDIADITEASDNLNIQALSKSVIKYFICYPKGLLN
ncbi:MAG: HD domain-containing protein [Flavobacteriaceae bacterium]|nr:HD domain-containing protein [Flavobacteriaceae bacterium]